MQDYPTLAIPLSLQEQTDLQRYEQMLTEKLDAFYEVVEALVTIRNRKLYRATHRTFEAYCRERWQISRSRAYQLLNAADIKEDLTHHGQQPDLLPHNEAQTRALKAAPKDLRSQVWNAAVSSANGGQPSAPQIKRAVQTVLPLQDKPKATVDDIVECVLAHCKALPKPYPENALQTLYVVVNTMSGSHVTLDAIKDSLSSKYAPFQDNQAFEEAVIPQCVRVKETLEERHDVHLFNASHSYILIQCARCHKRILGGGVFHYTQRDEHVCIMCFDKPEHADTQEEQADVKNDTRTVPKAHDLQSVVRGFISVRHNEFKDSVDELARLCHGDEPDRFHELVAHCDTLFLPPEDGMILAVSRACENSLDVWQALQAYREKSADGTEPEPEGSAQEEQQTKELLCTCNFCEQLFCEKHVVTHRACNGVSSTICRKCASKALYHLLDPTDPTITTLEHVLCRSIAATQGSYLISKNGTDDNQSHDFYGEDRVKICQAGLRILNCEANTSDRIVLKEFTLFEHGESGRWLTREKLPSKAALKRRFEELRTDPHIIFDGHL